MSKLLHPLASESRVICSSSGRLETDNRQSISRHLPGHGGQSRVLSALNRLESHRWRRWLYRLQARLRGLPTPLSWAQLPGGDQQIVRSLRQQGGFQTSLKALDLPMNPQFLQAAHRLAARLPNPQEAKASSAPDHLGHCIHGDAAQIVRDYPEVLLWGLEERLLDLVEAYVQLPVSYLGVNLRKDIPNGQQVGTRLWHLDGEDTCVVKILVYLSDVEREHGPFEYVPKSQFNSTYRYLSPKYWQHQTLHCHDENMEKIVGRDRWQSATGAAGSVVFADTTQVFHHGAVPTQERVALIFAYATRMPKKLDFCKQFFPAESLLPSLRPRLSARQWDCVWGWRRMAELTDS